jgi:hypothetical protein
MPANSVSVTAMFSPQNRQVYVSSAGNGSTSPSGTAIQQVNTNASVQAFPNTNYHFDHWVFGGSGGDGGTGANPSYVTLSSNRTATAYFAYN